MFGPGIPIYERDRIHRLRLIGWGTAAGIAIAIAFVTVRWSVGYTPPPHMGLLGKPLLISEINEIAPIKDDSRNAGGHPMPQAIAALQIEEIKPVPEKKPLLPKKTIDPGEAEREIPDTIEPDPGPAIGDGKAAATTRPEVSTTDDVVILKFVRPTYPSDARLLGNEGRVVVRARIDEAGLVAEIHAEPEDGLFQSCVDAATKAVEQFRFKPFTIGGRPETGWVKISFKFELRGVSVGSPERSST